MIECSYNEIGSGCDSTKNSKSNKLMSLNVLRIWNTIEMNLYDLLAINMYLSVYIYCNNVWGIISI